MILYDDGIGGTREETETLIRAAFDDVARPCGRVYVLDIDFVGNVVELVCVDGSGALVRLSKDDVPAGQTKLFTVQSSTSKQAASNLPIAIGMIIGGLIIGILVAVAIVRTYGKAAMDEKHRDRVMTRIDNMQRKTSSIQVGYTIPNPIAPQQAAPMYDNPTCPVPPSPYTPVSPTTTVGNFSTYAHVDEGPQQQQQPQSPVQNPGFVYQNVSAAALHDDSRSTTHAPQYVPVNAQQPGSPMYASVSGDDNKNVRRPTIQDPSGLRCNVGVMERAQAETILNSQPDGTYLVRTKANDPPNHFVISMKVGQRFVHHKVETLSDGFMINGKRGQGNHNSMYSILRHLESTADNIQVRLGKAYTT
ncbi:hypothetical protein PTSG_01600 [Salpingoeca rosetta]|uniref:SH2 domain-containing protein n=1 Tax=Salpingoeca rosetta (strain ATCC 50818 / BSB-021) TaxID=946362 RepID=F2TYE8_SALR5|nr:uncharacterized protein PTSG_01600 [Salpingoeca rosetta]EGD78622.1 hypothetical protein PTSG_01600 [Salpingoeca rosetta]|eukprot:XP_004997580.1 hypothetical protein PTSG_01600 [Salpingoeca rosetta]